MEPSDLLRYVAETLERIGADYLVTGSTVTIAFGEPRFTNDIDIIVDLKPQQVAKFCQSFPEEEFYINEQSVRDAVENKRQFNVIHPSSGMKVDFFIRKNSQFDDSRFARVKRVAPFADFYVCFASLEDVIVKKLEYYHEGGSEKHLRDISGVLRISGEQIDCAYIEEWSDRLGLKSIWQAVLSRLQDEESS